MASCLTFKTRLAQMFTGAETGSSAAENAWIGVKTVLPAVEKVSVIFPPLQSALGGLIDVTSLLKTYQSNVNDWEEFTQAMERLRKILAPRENVEAEERKQFQHVASAINDLILTINSQQGNARWSEVIRRKDDQAGLLKGMQRVKDAVNTLQLYLFMIVEERTKSLENIERLDRLKDVSWVSFDTAAVSECVLGTRVQLLEKLHRWASNLNGAPVFWLNGLAGTGKTTLAHSFCKSLNAYCGSFFWSSADGDRSDIRRIVPTLAFQLAHHPQFQAYRSRLCCVLEQMNKPEQGISEMFHQLLWEPLESSLKDKDISHPFVVVVDGLDECPDMLAASELLRAILSGPKTLSTHLRFLIVSRSEPHIVLPIEGCGHKVQKFSLQDVPDSVVRHDLRTYLETELQAMCTANGWENDWFGYADVEQLVSKAGSLFIYAVTALKFLRGSVGLPRKRLHLIKTEDGAFPQTLYLLYAAILNNLLGRSNINVDILILKRILFTLSYSPSPLRIGDMAGLFDLDLAELRSYLGHLSSVVLIPEESEEDINPVQFFHVTFAEFIRSGSPHQPIRLRLDLGAENRDMMLSCLRIMILQLQEGLIENVQDRRVARHIDISDLRIFKSISPLLRYASRYWLCYLAESTVTQDTSQHVISVFSTFIHGYLLRWLECLAWIGYLNNIEMELQMTANITALHNINPYFERTFSDISRFIFQNSSILERHPLEVYHSALVWLPASVCEPLSRERSQRSLPTVIHGLNHVWHSQERKESQVKESVIQGSLFTVPDILHARWLSRPEKAKVSEVTVHEWDTHADREIRVPISLNRRSLCKLASNGIFSYDMRTHELAFILLAVPLVLQSETPVQTWKLRLDLAPSSRRAEEAELVVSTNGEYVVVGYRRQGSVCLIDCKRGSYTWLAAPRRSFLADFMFFSPDASLLGVYLYDTEDEGMEADLQQHGHSPPKSAGSVQIFDTASATPKYFVAFSSNDPHFASFSPDSSLLVIQRSPIGTVRSSKALDLYVAQTGVMQCRYGTGAGSQHLRVWQCCLRFQSIQGWDTVSQPYLGIPAEHDVCNSDAQLVESFSPGKESQNICMIPFVYRKWDQQAQIEGTHLFLASTAHGMLILKSGWPDGSIGTSMERKLVNDWRSQQLTRMPGFNNSQTTTGADDGSDHTSSDWCWFCLRWPNRFFHPTPTPVWFPAEDYHINATIIYDEPLPLAPLPDLRQNVSTVTSAQHNVHPPSLGAVPVDSPLPPLNIEPNFSLSAPAAAVEIGGSMFQSKGPFTIPLL